MAKTSKKATKASSSKVKEAAQSLNDEIRSILSAKADKLYTFTSDEMDKFREVEEALTNVRRALQRMNGAENMSTVMFEMGAAYSEINRYEDVMSALLDKHIGCCDDEDTDYDC